MQNFTLGKKGYSMLLFALVLLIGSSPSFGQTCPDPGNFPASQEFCYLQTIDDLETDGFPVFQTSDTENDTQPIPGNELLTDDTTYFVNSSTGDCRSPLSVTVTNAPRPANIITNSVVSGFEFTTCTPASFNSTNLADLFVAQTNYRIEVYASEESTTPLVGATLSTGDSYFVGQVPTVDAAAGSCPSFRVAVGFNPNQIEAPIAETPQIFCENATVADLVAQGTYDDTQAIRWYRSQTANSPLSDNTQLINGQTYYAAQVVNSRGSILPPCETPAGDRAPVLVELTDPIVINTPDPGIVCETDVQTTFPSEDAIRNFYLDLLESGVPRNGTFSPNAGQIAQMYQNDADGLGDFTTTYTVGEGSCESSVDLTISVVPTEDANAGTIEDITLPCGSTDIVILDDDLLSDDATTGGTFSGTGVNADGNFDPTTVSAGTYTITYSVDDSANCVTPGTSSSTTFDIIVGDGTGANGGSFTGVVCEDDVQTLFPSNDEVRKYLRALLGSTQAGTFNPTVAQLIDMYQADADGLGDFTTIFTPTNGSCNTATELTISVVPVEDANAGTIEDITLPCGSTDIVILDDDLLSDDATTGGTFSGTGVNADGNFDPTTVSAGTYTITYSVDDSANCVTPGTSSSTTFDIIVGDGTIGESFTGIVCIEDVPALFPSNDEVRKFLRALLGSNQPGTFNPTVADLIDTYQADADGLGDFITTFTPNNGTCNTATELTISVVPVEDADAGTIEDINVTCESEDIVILDDSLLSDDATTGGTFSGTGVNSDGNFDPSVGPGTYVITYSVDDSANCVTTGTFSSTTFDIIVGDGTIGESFTGIVCIEDVPALFSSNDEVRKYLRALLGSNQPGTFSPTVAQLINTYQADADGLGDFTTTFTPNNGTCNTATELTISVVPVEDANAGTIEDINVTCESEDIVILDDSLLSDDATTGGIFSGTGVNSDGNFDPSVGPGTYVITYSVDDSANCVTIGTTDSVEFNVIVGDATNSVGTPVNQELCITEVFGLISNPSVAINYFNDIVAEFNPALDGDFTVEPAILATQIFGYINNPNTPSQTFVTNYTYVSNCGMISTDISLTINNTVPADSGTIADFSLCQNDENFDLFTKLTGDNQEGGTFSDDSGIIENGLFDISATGVYTITYTVSEDDLETCLSGTNSTEFKLTVTENTIVIGNDNIGIVCEADVPTLFPSVDEIRKYLINLLDQGVSKTAGTFSPTAAQLAQMYQNDADGFGDFNTTYTITDGECSSSVVLTLRVLESLDAPVAEVNQLFCGDDESTVADLAVTGQNVILFEDEALTIPAVLTTVLVDGSNYYAVSVSEDINICSSLPTVVTVSIIENAPAPIADANQDFCTVNDPKVGDLAITGDNITVYEDAELSIIANNDDALVDGEDYYATSFCSIEAVLITVTISDPADAPIAEASQSFCLIDNPTVGDIVVTGDNVVFFTDANLTTTADATSSLVSGMSYYAVSNNDSTTCTSEATEIAVTITDPSAPALTMDGDEFCRSDNPTVQDLVDNFTGSGVLIYTSSTGGTAISATTALQNGVTYYGASVDGTTGCESSERVAVVAKVEFCGIPEGFSPNGDGFNDRFVIPDIAESFPNYSIEIFNRWGNVVFKGNASTGDWDGISNQSGTLGNDVLPVGVYFYILNYNDGQTSPVQGKLYLSI